MNYRPSYDELKQRIKELEMESAMQKQAEEELRECEETYRMAVERSIDGVAIVIGDRHVYVNEKFARIFGYNRPDEVIGQPLSRFVHPDDQDRVINFNRLRQKNGNSVPSRYECKGVREDGHLIYLSVSANATTYRGKPASLVFMRDVTEQKLAEEKLFESEAKYRMIFENIQDVYYEVTLDGVIMEVSSSIEKVSEYKREQVIGKSLYNMYADPKTRADFIQELMKRGSVTDYEILLRDADGSIGYCSISAGLIRDEQGSPEKIVGSLRNITERKKMEQALRKSESEMRAILEASIDRICHLDQNMRVIWVNKVAASVRAVAISDGFFSIVIEGLWSLIFGLIQDET